MDEDKDSLGGNFSLGGSDDRSPTQAEVDAYQQFVDIQAKRLGTYVGVTMVAIAGISLALAFGISIVACALWLLGQSASGF